MSARSHAVGVPVDVDQWGWICGFYPGTEPHGTAATFDRARSSFEAAWYDLLPTLTEVDFDRWRDQRDCAQIRDVGTRGEDAFAKAKFVVAVSPRRSFRQSPVRTHADPSASHHRDGRQ
jgi:hypothetical protein